MVADPVFLQNKCVCVHTDLPLLSFDFVLARLCAPLGPSPLTTHCSPSPTPWSSPHSAVSPLSLHSVFIETIYSKTTAATILTLIISLLVLEQIVYRSKKAHLPGDKWTIPVIGKFADSLNPTLENYKKQWYSGPLSCVSVFNM